MAAGRPELSLPTAAPLMRFAGVRERALQCTENQTKGNKTRRSFTRTHPSVRRGLKGLKGVLLRAVVKTNTDEIQNSARRLLGLCLAAQRGKTGCGRGLGPLYGCIVARKERSRGNRDRFPPGFVSGSETRWGRR